jgi:hypothetical protein
VCGNPHRHRPGRCIGLAVTVGRSNGAVTSRSSKTRVGLKQNLDSGQDDSPSPSFSPLPLPVRPRPCLPRRPIGRAAERDGLPSPQPCRRRRPRRFRPLLLPPSPLSLRVCFSGQLLPRRACACASPST